MIDKIMNFVSSNMSAYMDYVFYALLGIQAVVFIIGLVCALGNGELNAFKKLAKKFLKGEIRGETSVMKLMPVKIKKQYKRARKTPGAKPSDYITVDSCVLVPYSASLMSKLAPFTAYTTVLVAILGMGLGAIVEGGLTDVVWTMGACIAVLGVVLTALSAIISHASKSGALKLYDRFMAKIDGGPGEEAEPEVMQQETVAEVETEAEPEETAPVIDSAVFEEPTSGGYDIPTRDSITYEPATEQREEEIVIEQPAPEAVMVETPAVDPAAERARAKEEAIAAMRAEQERIRREHEEAAAQEAERARAEAEAKAREAQAKAQEQAEARAKAQAEARARMQAQQAQAQRTVPPQTAAAAEAKANAATTEDVIARIEQINKEGAPLSTMKEVALLLQKERAKPENKTPEQQRKLNEALSKLLKAMSAARK